MENEIIHIIFHNGFEYWLNENDHYHRDDGPAIVHPNGTEKWLEHNNYYRKNDPAVIHISGKEEWFENGKTK